MGRAAERDFDWKSVQTPEQWREDLPDDPRDEPVDYDEQAHADDRYHHNGYQAAPAPAYAPPPPPAATRSSAPRRSAHAPADVTPATGSLTIQGVQKSFGSRMVVRGVSLSLRRGEAVGLLGPNGAGKTTVFYMITGLIKADAGRIQFDGHDITHLPMYQRARLGIGYLPQEASIFRGLNVEDNIRAVLEVVEPNKRKREEELDQLLDEPFAGIDPIAVGDIQNLVHHLKQRGIGVLITDHNVRETLGLTDRA
ncbi:MAG: ATP-binding cassette domain-containing protein, partial [Alphaproteobacteria bacterium]|nr:ATP-binding cassette domain-containing protein [Alphaproteobacteria bacterium]